VALRAATRGSKLARWQTDYVLSLLGGGLPVVVATLGDQRTDVPVHELGGQGVFVKEVQAALLDGRADIAVHSAKDLTSTPTEGLVIGAFPPRGEVRDALVGCSLSALAAGAVVATGSVRRRAQLAALRPDLGFAELRGNVDTRMAKAAGFDAIVVAGAALERLGYLDQAAVELLDPSLLLPQVGQGALAVECREGDSATLAALAGIDDPATRSAVSAERAFLAELGGGCELPVGAYGVVVGDGDGGDVVRLTGLLASLDGRVVLRHTMEGASPAVGTAVARYLLDDAGGAGLLP
jgi:hydroxymethylbilane synthase